MSEKPKPDWDPRSADVLRDQVDAYDTMREHCPVAYSEKMGWSVFRHESVMQVLHDPTLFSSLVSNHLSVPSGMDPPEHTVYRTIVEKYFTDEIMAAFEPGCLGIVNTLVQDSLRKGHIEFMSDFAMPFAVRTQCEFLGWAAELEEPLIQWTLRNRTATLQQDRKAMAEIAREFEAMVDDLLKSRVEAGGNRKSDITASLMHDSVWGRPLSHEEIASILRNWTVGEIGTISAAVGILVQFLAQHVDLQSTLRADFSLLPKAIHEILRIHGPLVANRRITTQPVEINGRTIDAGQMISINWIAANRDGRVFDQPDCFKLDRDPSKNLLYGSGLHVCPGAPLARLEMRICMEELLQNTSAIQLDPEHPPTKAVYPASGFAHLPVLLVP